jgi:nitrate reductase NapE component
MEKSTSHTRGDDITITIIGVRVIIIHYSFGPEIRKMADAPAYAFIVSMFQMILSKCNSYEDETMKAVCTYAPIGISIIISTYVVLLLCKALFGDDGRTITLVVVMALLYGLGIQEMNTLKTRVASLEKELKILKVTRTGSTDMGEVMGDVHASRISKLEYDKTETETALQQMFDMVDTLCGKTLRSHADAIKTCTLDSSEDVSGDNEDVYQNICGNLTRLADINVELGQLKSNPYDHSALPSQLQREMKETHLKLSSQITALNEDLQDYAYAYEFDVMIRLWKSYYSKLVVRPTHDLDIALLTAFRVKLISKMSTNEALTQLLTKQVDTTLVEREVKSVSLLVIGIPAVWPVQYVGTYRDSAIRAFRDNRGRLSFDQCRQAAAKDKMSYFGIQDCEDTNGCYCFVGNDLDSATRQGKLDSHAPLMNGLYIGKGWENAIYQIDHDSTIPQHTDNGDSEGERVEGFWENFDSDLCIISPLHCLNFIIKVAAWAARSR